MQGVVFDFDGTLVDSEGVHEEALVAACAAFDLTIAPGFGIGLPDREAVARALRAQGRDTDLDVIESIVRHKGDLFGTLMRSGACRFFPGSVELIRLCRAEGLPLAICSASKRDEILQMLEGAGVLDAFAVVVSVEDVRVSKPDPSCYRLSADRLGLPAHRCVAIEDSPHGIAAARGAGFATIGVEHSFDRTELVEAHVHVSRIEGLTIRFMREVVAGVTRTRE